MPLGSSTVTISYGSFNFSNMPTPYVSRSQEMVFHGKKWAQATSIELMGSIIGASSATPAGKGNWVALNRERDEILGAFSKDFQTLTVTEDSSNILEFKNCIIRGVNFSEANQGKIDYTISLECYLESEFNGAFGVIDPENTFSYEAGENGIVSVRHSISARGLQSGSSTATPNQALNTAINFVNGLTGAASHHLAGVPASNFVLENLSKNVDRTTATYSVDEQYSVQTGNIYDVPLTAGYTTEVSTSVSSGISEEFINVSVEFSINGGKSKTAAEVRSAYQTATDSENELYRLATGACGQLLHGLSPAIVLNTIPISYDVSDNADASRQVSVRAAYNNDNIHDGVIGSAYFDYTISIETDEVTSTTTVSIEGDLKARSNHRNKYEAVNNYYLNTIVAYGTEAWLWGLAYPIYTGRLGTTTPWNLNDLPGSFSVRKNAFKGEISLKASFDNRDFLSGFTESRFDLDVQPSLNLYSSKPSANKNGLYGIYDLGVAKREKVNFGGNFVSDASNTSYKSIVGDFIDSGKEQYVDGNSVLINGVNVDLAGPILLEGENVNVEAEPYFSIGFGHNYSRKGNKGGTVFH